MWPNLQFRTDLVTFTEEILNGKLHFLCSDCASDDLPTAGNAEWLYKLRSSADEINFLYQVLKIERASSFLETL